MSGPWIDRKKALLSRLRSSSESPCKCRKAARSSNGCIRPSSAGCRVDPSSSRRHTHVVSTFSLGSQALPGAAAYRAEIVGPRQLGSGHEQGPVFTASTAKQTSTILSDAYTTRDGRNVWQTMFTVRVLLGLSSRYPMCSQPGHFMAVRSQTGSSVHGKRPGDRTVVAGNAYERDAIGRASSIKRTARSGVRTRG